MSWTFQGIAYQTKRDYYAAIVQEYLSAGGANCEKARSFSIYDRCKVRYARYFGP
jgi:hypothetical protein